MEKGLTKNDTLGLKGLAILMLIFHHLFLSPKRFAGFTVSFLPFSQGLVTDVSSSFKICVSIFAFITGYGLLKSVEKMNFNGRNCFNWYTNRLVKTMSGFWIIYVIAFIVTMCINQLPLKTYSGNGIFMGILYPILDFLGLANIFSTPSLCGTWWYMGAAIVFIVCVPLFFKFAHKFGYLPLLIVLIVMPRILNWGFPGGMNAYTFITPVVLGMVFADYNVFEWITDKSPKNRAGRYILHFVVFGIMVVIATFAATRLNREYFWEINYGLIPLAYILFYRYCIVRIPGVKHVLMFLGRHSMTIFLTHTFLRVNYLPKFIYNWQHFLLIFLIMAAMSIALAFVIDMFIKLIRYQKLVDFVLGKFNKKFPMKRLE